MATENVEKIEYESFHPDYPATGEYSSTEYVTNKFTYITTVEFSTVTWPYCLKGGVGSGYFDSKLKHDVKKFYENADDETLLRDKRLALYQRNYLAGQIAKYPDNGIFSYQLKQRTQILTNRAEVDFRLDTIAMVLGMRYATRMTELKKIIREAQGELDELDDKHDRTREYGMMTNEELEKVIKEYEGNKRAFQYREFTQNWEVDRLRSSKKEAEYAKMVLAERGVEVS